MKDFVLEPERKVPVTGAYDVVVAGGGIAGVAAAVAAARNGASVCLLDKESGLGGLATLGNVIVWLPICDGRGRQVIGGLGEELLRLSVADLGQNNPTAQFFGVPTCWLPGGDAVERKKKRYVAHFNPVAYTLALEKLVVDNGVTLLYDTRVCQVQRDGERIRHVIIENKSGRQAVAARVVVDATGDADLCYLGGEQTESLDSNVLCGWFYLLKDGVPHLQCLSNRFDPNCGKNNADGPFLRGDDAEQVTAHILGTRDLVRRRIAEWRELNPGVEIQPFQLPTIACFRMTRRLVGEFSLGERHMHQFLPDATGFTGDWRKAGPVYSIPLRALRGVRNRNLLTAGRCISADTTVWDATRAIPTCAVTGEAAGTAAALAAKTADGDVHALDVARLQAVLRDQRVLLDPALVAAALAD